MLCKGAFGSGAYGRQRARPKQFTSGDMNMQTNSAHMRTPRLLRESAPQQRLPGVKAQAPALLKAPLDSVANALCFAVAANLERLELCDRESVEAPQVFGRVPFLEGHLRVCIHQSPQRNPNRRRLYKSSSLGGCSEDRCLHISFSCSLPSGAALVSCLCWARLQVVPAIRLCHRHHGRLPKVQCQASARRFLVVREGLRHRVPVHTPRAPLHQH